MSLDAAPLTCPASSPGECTVLLSRRSRVRSSVPNPGRTLSKKDAVGFDAAEGTVHALYPAKQELLLGVIGR